MNSNALERAKSDYLANADYFALESRAKAATFVTACTELLVLLPTVIKGGGAGELQWSLEAITGELAKARSWLASSRGSGVRLADLSHFR